MKKIYLYLLAGFILLTTNSCSDYLDVDHYDILPGDYMFLSKKTAEEGLIGCYDTFYPDKDAFDEFGVDLAMWGFKPHFMLANHPTMDTQAGGWDKSYNTQDWTASSDEFLQLWVGHYRGVSRCNYFLAGLEDMEEILFEEKENEDDPDVDGKVVKARLEAQARAIRAYNYFHLARNFGRIPMLMSGEDFMNTPAKSRAETIEETWELVVADLEYAAGVLDWTPINDEYGRITKGFCLSYLGMVKMYQGKYDEAKPIFKQVIDSNTYSLVPAYSYLFDTETAWTTEDIFAVVMWTDNGNNMHGWGNGWNPTDDHYMFTLYNTASPEHGGWGSLYLSWEFYESFENGDRRRDASAVPVGGTNPWTGQTITGQVKTSNECLPNIFSMKYWRMTADYNVINAPFAIRYLRYPEILLDYAECCFRTSDPAGGWNAIKQVRERAFGQLEINANLAASDPTYPIPLLGTGDVVTIPDAETYYTQYKATKGYSADAWLIAVNMERRFEFNSEQGFFYDLRRSGMIEEYINLEYPKNVGLSATAEGAYDSKPTYRNFDINMNKLNLYPIPYQEILTNNGIDASDQNPGY